MVKRKNYLLNPISRQNFADALAENNNLKLEVCHTLYIPYVELQDQWNGPYFFFLKSIAQPPVNETAPIFFLGEFSHHIIML